MKNLLILLLLIAFASCAPAQDLSSAEKRVENKRESLSVERKLVGKVVAVADGDTITILDDARQQYKIRLEGIDAPESKQDFGQRAKQNLSDLVFGKTVSVITSKVDKYKRYVGKVIIEGRDVNLEQIKAGFAWHYTQYAAEQKVSDRFLYRAEEIKARNAKIGLWSDPNPTAPWNWRRGGSSDTPAERSTRNREPAQNSAVRPSGRTYVRGPRGGCYYINSNGNKTYVDRSLCN